MKTFQELLNDSRSMQAEAGACLKFLQEDARARYIAITGGRLFRGADLTEDQRAALQELHAEEKEKSDRYNLLKVAQRVLFDNIRQAYFQETMPKVLDVLRLHQGKPYGPVLKNKIDDELKPLGVRVYISTEPEYRSDELYLSPIDHPYIFNNSEMTVLTKFVDAADGREKRPMLGGTTGNRLQVYGIEDYILYNCKIYAEDPMIVAADLIEKYRNVKEQFDQVEKDLRALNDLLPARIDWIDTGKLHYAGLASHLS